MKKHYSIFLLIISLTIPLSSVCGASYCLFDKENKELLFMDKNDTQFSGKIDMEEKPDQIISTDDPNKYLAIYAPQAPEKAKHKTTQKGKLVLFNSNTFETEDIIELGYAPFKWVSSRNNKDLYISYKPSLESDTLELLHYEILQKKTEKLTDFTTKQLFSISLSYDEMQLFALVWGDKKAKTTGQVVVVNTAPLTISNTIETTLDPQGLYILGPDKIVIIDTDFTLQNLFISDPGRFVAIPSDERKGKEPGCIKILNSSDYSIIEKYELSAPYFCNWYPDEQTLFALSESNNKSLIYKVTSRGVETFNTDGFIYRFYKYKNQLFLLANNTLKVVDLNTKQETVCDTENNRYTPPFDSSHIKHVYEMNYIPEMNLMILLGTNIGKVKIIDLTQNQMIQNCSYGRSGKKFGNFMKNLAINVLVNIPGYSYYTPIQTYDYFNQGGSFIVDKMSRYLFLNTGTKDVTVFDKSFETPQYIVTPDESPLAMFQINKSNPQIWLVSDAEIYLINPDDLSLKPIYDFKVKIKSCVFFEEEKRLIALTDQEVVVIDPNSLEVKGSNLLYNAKEGERNSRPAQKEPRYYFIPIL